MPEHFIPYISRLSTLLDVRNWSSILWDSWFHLDVLWWDLWSKGLELKCHENNDSSRNWVQSKFFKIWTSRKCMFVSLICLEVYYLYWQQELPLNRTMISDVWCWNVKLQAPCLLASISFLATHPPIGYFLAFPTTATSFMFDFSLAEHQSYPVQIHTGHQTVGWTVLIMGCLTSCIPVLYY